MKDCDDGGMGGRQKGGGEEGKEKGGEGKGGREGSSVMRSSVPFGQSLSLSFSLFLCVRVFLLLHVMSFFSFLPLPSYFIHSSLSIGRKIKRTRYLKESDPYYLFITFIFSRG